MMVFLGGDVSLFYFKAWVYSEKAIFSHQHIK